MNKNKDKKNYKDVPLQLAKAFSADDIYAIIEPYLDVLQVEDNNELVDFFLNFGPYEADHFYTTPADEGIAVWLDAEGNTAHYIEDLKELEQLLRTRGKSAREWMALRRRLNLSDDD